ncbi:MAG: hypothetical protein ACI8XM_002374 [Haloarculaceae archaeon]|jgi:hypothetical protein
MAPWRLRLPREPPSVLLTTARFCAPRRSAGSYDDVLLALGGKVSPSALGVAPAIAPPKPVRGTPVRPTGANPPGAKPGCLGLCAIRESREGCGVFGVPTDAVSPCTVHPRRPRGSWGIPPNVPFGASGHGSCHRPACPFCHGGQAQTRQARVVDTRLSAGAAVGVSPVEGVLSTTPTGGTPNHLQFSALSYRRDGPGGHKHRVRTESGRIHARRERRDSLLDSGR